MYVYSIHIYVKPPTNLSLYTTPTTTLLPLPHYSADPTTWPPTPSPMPSLPTTYTPPMCITSSSLSVRSFRCLVRTSCARDPVRTLYIVCGVGIVRTLRSVCCIVRTLRIVRTLCSLVYG